MDLYHFVYQQCTKVPVSPWPAPLLDSCQKTLLNGKESVLVLGVRSS